MNGKLKYSYPERSDNKLATGEVFFSPKAATGDREANSILHWYYQKSAEAIVAKETSSDKSEKTHN